MKHLNRLRRKISTDTYNTVNKILLEETYLGELQSLKPDQVLHSVVEGTENHKFRKEVDDAVRKWFDTNWGKTPEKAGVSPGRWNNILRSAFLTVVSLELTYTHKLLVDKIHSGRKWLNSLRSTQHSPEVYLLRALAVCQVDSRRPLQPLWIRLCRLKEERPYTFSAYGVLGLSELPLEESEDRDVPRPLFYGIIELATELGVRFRKDVEVLEEARRFWKRRIDYVRSRFDKPESYWEREFSKALVNIEPTVNNTAENWLRLKLSKLDDRASADNRQFRSSRDLLEKFNSMIEKLNDGDDPLDLKDEILQLREEYLMFAQSTGRYDEMIRKFHKIAEAIHKALPILSRKLMENAYYWDPYNEYVWSMFSKIMSVREKEEKAIDILWASTRRFPDNEVVWTELANKYKGMGKYEISHTIYKHASEEYENIYALHGTAATLKRMGLEQERDDLLGEAEQTYLDIINRDDKSENHVTYTDLAEVYLKQGKTEKAQETYEKSIELYDDAFSYVRLAVLHSKENNEDEAVSLLKTAKSISDATDDVDVRRAAEKLLNKLSGDQEPEISDVESVLDEIETVSAEDYESEEAPATDEAASDQSSPEQTVSGQSTERSRPRVSLPSVFPDNGSLEFESKLSRASFCYIIFRNSDEENLLKHSSRSKYHYLERSKELCKDLISSGIYTHAAYYQQGLNYISSTNGTGSHEYFKDLNSPDKYPSVFGFHIGESRSFSREKEDIKIDFLKGLLDKFPEYKTLTLAEILQQRLSLDKKVSSFEEEQTYSQLGTSMDYLPEQLRPGEKRVRSTLQNLFSGNGNLLVSNNGDRKAETGNGLSQKYALNLEHAIDEAILSTM